MHVERRPARPDDVRRIVLDIAVLRSLLPFDPLPIREGLARTWTAMSEAALAPT